MVLLFSISYTCGVKDTKEARMLLNSYELLSFLLDTETCLNKPMFLEGVQGGE